MATRDRNDDEAIIIATRDRNNNDLAIDVKATHLASFFVCVEMLYRVFRCKGPHNRLDNRMFTFSFYALHSMVTIHSILC